MCHFYRQRANLNDIKQGVMNLIVPIVRLLLFQYSLFAFMLTMVMLKRKVQERKQVQPYNKYPEWYHSTTNELVTIPIANRQPKQPAPGSAVSSLRLYPTSAR